MNASSNHDQGGDNEQDAISASSRDADGGSINQDRLSQHPSEPRQRDEANTPETAESDSDELQAREAGEIRRPEADREELIEEVAARAAATMLHLERHESYSGLLPDGENWHKYEPETKERILRMSESFTTDESGRRDRIVDAQITEAPKGRRTASWMMGGAFACSLASKWLFDDTALALGFLALPVIWGVISFLPKRQPKPNEDD